MKRQIPESDRTGRKTQLFEISHIASGQVGGRQQKSVYFLTCHKNPKKRAYLHIYIHAKYIKSQNKELTNKELKNIKQRSAPTLSQLP